MNAPTEQELALAKQANTLGYISTLTAIGKTAEQAEETHKKAAARLELVTEKRAKLKQAVLDSQKS